MVVFNRSRKGRVQEFWPFFKLNGPHGEHLFYRCPGCGATIDWRDHRLHLISHGVVHEEKIAELVKEQEEFAGVKHG